MNIQIILVKDYYLGEIDRLVAAGRLPAKNVEAAQARVDSMVKWLSGQPEAYFAFDIAADENYADAQNRFFEKVGKDYSAK